MKNYVIINGTNSNTLTGLMINELPPITKPEMRTQIEEIDGRDGDIITKLGYSAYDKTITIGLFGTGYDVDNIIKFFNKEGTIVFSNEPDKYYNFTQVNGFDIERLLKFKTASITFHCQPFKYPIIETQKIIQPTILTSDGESITINNTASDSLKLSLKGNTSQASTPTPTSPIPVSVVSGDNEVVVCGKNLYSTNNVKGWMYGSGLPTYQSDAMVIDSYGNGNLSFHTTTNSYLMAVLDAIQLKPNTSYIVSYSRNNTLQSGVDARRWIYTIANDNTYTVLNAKNSGDTGEVEYQFTTGETGKIAISFGFNNNSSGSSSSITNFMVRETGQSSTYEPYKSQTYEVDLPVENLIQPISFTKTNNGITYTYNTSGAIEVSGTASAASHSMDATEGASHLMTLQAGTYTISGATDKVLIQVLNSSNSELVITTSSVFSKSFTLNATTQIWYRLRVPNGTNINDGITIKPQLEKGSKQNSFTPYGTTPIELCKIGTYQDYIYKDSGKWYLHKEVGKLTIDGTEAYTFEYNTSSGWVAPRYTIYNFDTDYTSATSSITSMCNLAAYTTDPGNYTQQNEKFVVRYVAGQKSRIDLMSSTLNQTSSAAFKTWLGTHNLILYYVMKTPTNTEITDTNLIEQLDNLSNATSYEGTTNISQTNNDKPFIISASAVQSGTNEITINNIGNTYAKPTIALEGNGNVDIYLDNTQILKANVESKMNIDINTLEAYNPDTSALLNRQVIGNYNSMTFQPGNNKLTINGSLSKATITNYTRYL